MLPTSTAVSLYDPGPGTSFFSFRSKSVLRRLCMPPPLGELWRWGLYLSGLGIFLVFFKAYSRNEPNVTFYLPTPMLTPFLLFISKSLFSLYEPGGGRVFLLTNCYFWPYPKLVDLFEKVEGSSYTTSVTLADWLLTFFGNVENGLILKRNVLL